MRNAVLEHDDQFALRALSVCPQISKETFVWARGYGRNAPISDFAGLVPDRGGSTLPVISEPRQCRLDVGSTSFRTSLKQQLLPAE